uniref:CSON010140 protein n=1 Tax=Culicoides sonorensis TaxID=179676 RepID=A0A336K2Y6_CULSO
MYPTSHPLKVDGSISRSSLFNRNQGIVFWCDNLFVPFFWIRDWKPILTQILNFSYIFIAQKSCIEYTEEEEKFNHLQESF